nr:inositol-pentakisphosphate 2-kinase isoform X1 [Leptinotarsa decemlineata]
MIKINIENVLKRLYTIEVLLDTLKRMLSSILMDQSAPVTDFEIPSEWIYRGEGNMNVVISLPKLGKILRIRKTDRPKSLIEWLVLWISDFLYWYWGKGVEEEMRDLKFYSTVMRPMVGRKYTSEAHQVVLTRKQIQILQNELSKYRPEFRKHKILQYGRASLFDDYAFMPLDEYDYLPFQMSEDTFAVELKPKQGWRPFSEKHYPACVFCMKQYLKLESKKISKLSEYCPEDLFSGDEIRMKRAIKSLISNPQNNFQVFKNGTLVYGEKSALDFSHIVHSLFEDHNEDQERLIDEFCELVRQSLVTNIMNVDFVEHCEEKLFCEWNKIIQQSSAQSALPRGCVLEKILSIQMLDTEGSFYYEKLLHREDIKDWNYINMLLDKIDNKHVCLKCLIMMLGDTNRSQEEMDLAFIPYLISVIMKDCSLMVTLKRIQEDISDNLELKNIIKTNYGYFLVNIGVFDLYPKRLSSIKMHCKRNKNILDAYMKATTKSNKLPQ